MKKIATWALSIVVVLVVGFYALNAYIYNEKQGDGASTPIGSEIERQRPDVAPTGLIGGGWTWVRSELPGGKVIEAPAGGAFVVSFDEDGLVSAATDCNGINGSYVKDEEVLSIGPLGMTKMYCEGSLDTEFAKLLGMTGSHVIEGGTLRLILTRDAGTMTFTR